MKKITNIIIGAVLICCGVIYAINIFGICDLHFSPDGWWTLFIIFPCLGGLLTNKDKSGSLIGLGVGVLLLLAARDVIEYDMVWKIIVPVIIVLLGVKIIIKTVRPTNNESSAAEEAQGVDYNVDADTVAKVGAVFGGAVCNLKNAKITDGCHIDLMCVFGGADILVPENVTIKNNTFCLFGGISDKRAVISDAANGVTLYINGFCIFGGADIK